ncbi:MAG: 30S ribosomal protein S16 [Chitinophagales bacterium]|nr:30S ribosomal protein S16 [Chitinophagales bacterium]MDW8427085.1 30S ribosomal protein S16 [Chitinophagales bacterium]
MAVRLRLQRHGRKKHPFYHVVAAPQQAPRDGRFIEKVGYYDPTTQPETIEIDRDRAINWLDKGAQPTPTVRRLLRAAGVLYYRHLQRGIRLGVLTQEMAQDKWNKWLESQRIKKSTAAAQSPKRKKKVKKASAAES